MLARHLSKELSEEDLASVADVAEAEALIVEVVEVVAEAAVVEVDPGTEIKTTDLPISRMATSRNMDSRLQPHKHSLQHHTANPRTSNNNLLTVCLSHSLDTRNILSSNSLSSAKAKHPRNSPSSSPSSNHLRSRTPSRPSHKAPTSTLFSWLHCNSSSNTSRPNKPLVRHSRETQRL